MINSAKTMDPKLEFFKHAESCYFRRAVFIHSGNPRAWVNLALAHQCITGQYWLADSCYRMALDLDPLDAAGTVRQNIVDFLQVRFIWCRVCWSLVLVVVLTRLLCCLSGSVFPPPACLAAPWTQLHLLRPCA